MVDRRALGSWLEGPSSGRPADDTPPGARLGLPAEGPGSIAGLGRRVVALAVDWGISLLIATGLLRPLSWGSFAPLVVLLVMSAVLVGTAGATIGHRLLGLRVLALPGGGRPGPRRALVRAVLLCLAVPPLVVDRDQRGLHDRWAGTVLVLR